MRIDTEQLPRGFDAEIFSRRALEAAAREAVEPYEREHVTPFIWSRGGRFGATVLAVDRIDEFYRLCVDEPADFALVEQIIGALAPVRPDFGWRDIVALLRARPDWAKLNAHVVQKSAPATFIGP
jgi:spore coat polysaccharide biosynthesis protein SpsF